MRTTRSRVCLAAALGLLWVAAPATAARGGPGNRSDSPEALIAAAEDATRAAEERASLAAEAERAAAGSDEPHLRALALLALGRAELDRGRYREALNALHGAQRIFRASGDDWNRARCLRRIGDAQYRLGGHDFALRSYLEAAELLEPIAGPEAPRERRLALGHLSVMLGNVLRAVGEREQAARDYRKAAAVYAREGYEVGLAGVLLNLANLDEERGDLERALQRYALALAIARRLGNRPLERMALTNHAATLTALGRLDPAEAELAAATGIARELDDRRGLMYTQLKLGDLHRARGRLPDAVTAYEAALALADVLEDPDRQFELHGALAETLLELGRSADAILHLLAERRIAGERQVAERAATVARLRVAYEAERREEELALAEVAAAQERTRTRLLALALALALGMLAVTAWGLRTRGRLAGEVAERHTALAAAYRRLEEVSRTDELTGLLNRRAGLERLREEVARAARSGTPCSIALIDLDGFKTVNDSLGHAAGDAVLKEVGRRASASLRATDLLVRWGGDELMAVLPDTGAEAAREALERLLAAVRGTPVRWEEHEVGVSCSAGLVTLRGEEGQLEGLLAAADRALYRAKRASGGRIEAAGAAPPGAQSSPSRGPRASCT